MIANKTGTEIDYVLEEEQDYPPNDRTVFRLRTLSKANVAVIQDSLIGYDVTGSVITSRPGTGALTAVKLGVAGWTNMTDEDGNDVRPHFITSSKRTTATKRTPILSPKGLAYLPQRVIDELGSKVMELNGLTDAVEDEDAELEDSEDPTGNSATATASSSPQPSPPTTPKSATAPSATSKPAPDAPAAAPLPAPRLATDAAAAAG